MARIRTFIGIKLPKELCRQTERMMQLLHDAPATVKWVSTETLHISLNFLGDVEERNLGDICQIAHRAAANVEPFELILIGTGAFPNISKPRTLWIGVSGDVEQLVVLQKDLEEKFSEKGIRPDPRRYVPHLTLGRVRYGGKGSSDLSSILENHTETAFGVCQVAEITVFSSYLTRQGPIYSVVSRAPLG